MADEHEFQDTLAKFEAMEAAEGRPPALPEKDEALNPPEPIMEGATAKVPVEPTKLEDEKTEPQKVEDEFIEFTGKQKERFNKIYGRMRQLERQVQQYQIAPSVYQPPTQSYQTPVPQGFTREKPKLSQYEDADKWADAISDWSSEKAQFEASRALDQRLNQTHAAELAQKQFAEYQTFIDSKVAQGRERFQDFDNVSEDLAAVASQFMVNSIFKLQRFPEVVMDLGKNLAEVERIARLSPEDQIFELKSLERKLIAKDELSKKQHQKTPTKVETPGQGVQTQSPTVTKLRQDAIKSGNLRDFAKVFEAMDHST